MFRLTSFPFVALLLLVSGTTPAAASCRYFRTAYKVAHCTEVKPALDTKARPSESEAPWLENEEGPQRQILCACTYVLEGSDPRCDFDKIDEVPATVSAKEAGAHCELARNVCGDICSRTLEQ